MRTGASTDFIACAGTMRSAPLFTYPAEVRNVGLKHGAEKVVDLRILLKIIKNC